MIHIVRSICVRYNIPVTNSDVLAVGVLNVNAGVYRTYICTSRDSKRRAEKVTVRLTVSRCMTVTTATIHWSTRSAGKTFRVTSLPAEIRCSLPSFPIRKASEPGSGSCTRPRNVHHVRQSVSWLCG